MTRKEGWERSVRRILDDRRLRRCSFSFTSSDDTASPCEEDVVAVLAAISLTSLESSHSSRCLFLSFFLDLEDFRVFSSVFWVLSGDSLDGEEEEEEEGEGGVMEGF